MSSINDIRSSRYLKKEDVGEGVLVTIKLIRKENVAMDGAEPEHKFVAYFEEFEKPMVLNSTNAQLIAKITGAEDNIEEIWPGHKVVLYNDPNITFAGKLTGGIRVRAPKQPTKTDLPF
jgi:hypothetical protein